MKTLTLTSPPTKGADVTAAQKLLTSGHYGNFFPGNIDGEYGEQTAAAVRRAKFALGYPDKKINEAYGQVLASLLQGASLPLTYQVRRKQRLSKIDLGAKALQSAIPEIGVKESPPSSNDVTFSRWYGIVGSPWCAAFVSWNYVRAGSKSFKAGSYYAYCPYILHDAKSGVNGLAITIDPQPGDIVLYCWDGSGVPEHTGLFEKWTSKAAGTFTAVEGNTSVGNDSNGGEVMRRDRTTALVVAFVRVNH